MQDKRLSIEVIFLLKNTEETTGVEFTNEQLKEYIGIKKLEDFKLPTSTMNVVTQHNPSTNNTCMYLSLRDILIRTGIIQDISVEQLRFIGRLNPIPDGRMWDSDEESHRNALQRICDYFNISVQIHTRYGNNLVQC